MLKCVFDVQWVSGCKGQFNTIIIIIVYRSVFTALKVVYVKEEVKWRELVANLLFVIYRYYNYEGIKENIIMELKGLILDAPYSSRIYNDF